ncbi:hypothetical protein OEZ85_004132 [Tetradesmus obliquus]|uniref:Uncharacterized protein n=1 Tax=Tetradesmus obliquus TaxID=3088 RepID=A0ABY8UFU0_TETOB|nr:hypothetical protein OEZ85_004132 [Tetradesmus obliquus]
MADTAKAAGAGRSFAAAVSSKAEPASRQSPISTDTDVKMDQNAPTKSDSATTSGGVVNNTQPLTEEEAEQLMAPEELYMEEERLRKERETEAAAQAAVASEAVLNRERFAQLDALLNRAGMYTKFLTEQMRAYHEDAPQQQQGEQQQAEEEEEEEAAGKAKGGKRKRGAKAAASAAKRSKAAEAAAAAAAKGAAAAQAAAGAVSAAGTLAEKQKALLPLVQGELRAYQLAGVTWLISLYQNGLNGILADQMGLGKTVQTISFFSHLRAKEVYGPFLIIGPLSTLRNWVAEVKRWCPSMPVLEYHGKGAKARAELRQKHMPLGPAGPAFPCVVSTYEIVMADIKALARYNWKYVVVDEGHRLKNFECKLIRDLRMLPADNKLLLTGTPLQNNLGELWSLLNFLLPDIFGSLADFQAWFDFSAAVGSEAADKEILAKEQRNNVVSKLHSLLKPFMLRRLKADVEICLPRKQEVLLYAPMSEQQHTINSQLLEKTLGDEMAKLAEQEGTNSSSGNAKAKLNNVLMQMRKNCNHPDLITSAFTAELDYPTPEVLAAQSGKMALLDRLLKQLQPRGHKVLIFSQMTKMLDLIESYLEQSGHKPCRIDGSMAFEDRQDSIDAFNSDHSRWVFLLSTRAGGLGINLTAADTVIIYDSDWNPHQDLQAMDRCHRIGQTKPVLVLRLATAHSVEGRMLARACGKMALERLVIKKGVFKEVLEAGAGKSSAAAAGSSMSAAELLALLRADISMDDTPQSGCVDDAMLAQLLDRSWMLTPEERQQQQQAEAAGAGSSEAEHSKGKAAKGKGGRRASRGGAAAAEAAAAAGSSGQGAVSGLPYPASGVGYEVVQAIGDSGLLSNVNS